MKDQSHKEEMSAALRGDFERLRERGVSATLAPREEPQPEEPEPVPDTEGSMVAEDEPRQGWLARLLGR